MTAENGTDPYELAAAAAVVLAERTGVERHDAAVTLGSGWAAAADDLGTVIPSAGSRRWANGRRCSEAAPCRRRRIRVPSV